MPAARILLLLTPAFLGCAGCGGSPAKPVVVQPQASVQEPAAHASPLAPIQFDDVTAKLGAGVVAYSGMTAERHFPSANGTGLGMIDFDLDGWMDVFICQGCRLDADSPRPPCSLLQSRRATAFVDVAGRAGIDVRGYSAGVSSADANSDGFPDVHLTRVNEPFRFFVNNGDGTFTDRSKDSGLDIIGWGTSAAWLDYDVDGNPDLYVVTYGKWDLEWHRSHPCAPRGVAQKPGSRMYCGPPNLAPSPHFLFRSLGDGRFEESAKQAGVYRDGWPEEEAKKGSEVKRDWPLGGRGQGVVAVDLNNDARPDLYVANDLNENFTFLNVGGGKFRDVTEPCLAGKSASGADQAGMGVDGSDYNDDGFADLFVTNFYREYSTLYRNDAGSSGEAPIFIDVAEPSGVAGGGRLFVKWGTSFEDLDGDGRLDLLVVNGHVDDNASEAGEEQSFKQESNVWRNVDGERYEKLTSGLSSYFETKHNSRGAAFGDLFNDGQVHVAISHRDEPITILRNISRSARSKPYYWTQVSLVGVRSARDPVGARVEIHLKDRKLFRHIRGGRSYLSAHDPRLTVGLGDADRIEKFVVHWPSGVSQEIAKPEVGRLHVIRETH
jgi:enediyne biosynthesis protein E4